MSYSIWRISCKRLLSRRITMRIQNLNLRVIRLMEGTTILNKKLLMMTILNSMKRIKSSLNCTFNN
jgi:hypothetical protein